MLVKAWQEMMQKEYRDIVKGLSEKERRGLRKEWEEKLMVVLDNETVTLSATAHLKKAQKAMLQAVCIL